MSPSPLSLLAQAGVDSARQTWLWGPRKGEAGLCWLPGLRCPGPCHCPGQDGDTLLELSWCGAALQAVCMAQGMSPKGTPWPSSPTG